MGFYDDYIVPRIVDFACGMKAVARERKIALAGVKGRVVELGIGSGHNLPHYSSAVEKVTGVDPSGEGARLAAKRIAAAAFPVDFVKLPGEQIDAPDASFDNAVSTFSLCTIPDAVAALRQVHRVLRPEGRLYFLEHGRADEEDVRRWQDRMNGTQQFLFGGCNLNRPIAELIAENGFEIESLERYYAKGPKFLTSMYRGVARRRAPGNPASS